MAKDRSYWSHRQKQRRKLLRKVLYQVWDACWAIAPARHLDALFRKHRLLGAREELSIQEIIDRMPRGALENRRLTNYDALINILKEGTVLESENPLNYGFAEESTEAANVRMYKALEVNLYKSEECDDGDYDKLLEKSIRNSPIAARLVLVNDDYEAIKGKSIYLPDPLAPEDAGHLLLLTGFGVDANGIEFWEAQDSYGRKHGDGGYIRIARKQNLISDFFVMEIETEPEA
ncbi:unnamed protein product [Arabidopsis arenosa]|uniref:Peptidase C1A papain C-terminal domain-containing protein n=1 Tax=Arabidopsis arenosa TaxID=38785 RepID=A0A8S2AHY7_ARAAE|nr:unnamed protein product [Arabidopsis arenosa]